MLSDMMRIVFKELILVFKDIPIVLWNLVTLDCMPPFELTTINVVIWWLTVLLTIIFVPIWIISLPVLIPVAVWCRIRHKQDKMWNTLKGKE